MLKTANEYRRLKIVRDHLQEIPDLSETAVPRFQTGALLSHRRGQKRIASWAKYKQLDYGGGK